MAIVQRSVVADVAMDVLRLFCYIFCTRISLQPPLRSWTWLYHKKGNSTQNWSVLFCIVYWSCAQS